MPTVLVLQEKLQFPWVPFAQVPVLVVPAVVDAREQLLRVCAEQVAGGTAQVLVEGVPHVPDDVHM